MNFSKGQKITMLALICVGLFNPASVEILDEYFKMVYLGIFLVSVAWVVGFILKKAFTPEKVNVPKKSAKTQKAGKFIAT